MAALSRRGLRTTNIWPGFVDALSQVLMVVIFLLLIFVLTQFFLGQALSGRDQALVELRGQVEELATLLSLERKASTDLRANLTQLSADLQSSIAARD
ncbi:MAG: peptidoglycan-binding protein, partial [Hyphomicrobium sp.]